MMHIPMQKWNEKPDLTLAGQQSDKTLADYIKRKDDSPPKKTFDEWMDEPYFELNDRTTSRRQWWTDSEIDAAKDAWASARE
jgi:hypothetical protein